jgi:serine protease Do
MSYMDQQNRDKHYYINYFLVKKPSVFLISLLLLYGNVFGQKFDNKALEAQLHKAIQKAYPTSVFIADYDSTTKDLNGEKFSGVVVSADGIILTAAHVCSPNKIYLVAFPDGKEYTATGLGRLGSADAAIMKINEKGTWPYAEMGWSSTLKVNEPCISISYAGTFGPKRLPVVRFGYIADLLAHKGNMRTTCLMEPGDSGGPVFDVFGRVIGLHSNIELSLENNYEIPVDVYRNYWTALSKPENYTTRPPKDSIKKDPLEALHTGIKALQNISLYYADLEYSLGNYCLQIKSTPNNTERVVLGTIVSLEGFYPKSRTKNKSFIISKSSLVGKDGVAVLKSKESIPIKILARDKVNDLVLVEVDRVLKNSIKLKKTSSDTLEFKDLGKFLISPDPVNEAGVISVIATTQFALARKFRGGFLGASAIIKNDRVTLSKILANSPALISKLEIGDQVLSLNGKQVKTPDGLYNEAMVYIPGDTVTLDVVRKDSAFSKQLVLCRRMPANHVAEQFTDGKSVIRDGFTNIFIHDAKLKPSECGGPVFDIHGRFLGINLARISRTSSVAIPVEEIKKFIQNSIK